MTALVGYFLYVLMNVCFFALVGWAIWYADTLWPLVALVVSPFLWTAFKSLPGAKSKDKEAEA